MRSPVRRSVRVQARTIGNTEERRLMASILAAMKRNTAEARLIERNVAKTLVSPAWRTKVATNRQAVLRTEAKARRDARVLATKLRRGAENIRRDAARSKIAAQTRVRVLREASDPVLMGYAANAARRRISHTPKKTGGMGYMGPGGPMKRRL
jgi:hypothetical protein